MTTAIQSLNQNYLQHWQHRLRLHYQPSPDKEGMYWLIRGNSIRLVKATKGVNDDWLLDFYDPEFPVALEGDLFAPMTWGE